MDVKEKAKAYDEALKYAKSALDCLADDYICNYLTKDDIRGMYAKLFPELKEESKDEKIRKSLIDMLKNDEKCYLEEIAWLEKQGEQNNNEDSNILQRFSFYLYKDEPNILYLSGIYVNEDYRNKGIGTKILKVADEVAASMKCNSIRLKTKKDSNAERLYRTHGYNSLQIEERDEIWLEKQGEQKPTEWSEEDEGFLNLLLAVFTNEHPNGIFSTDNILIFNGDCVTSNRIIAWLKSLKERYTWKPSEEQMLAISAAINVIGKWTINGKYLIELHEQLKKLREE